MSGAPVAYPTVCPGHTMGIWEINYASTPEGVFFISACQDKLPMLRDGVTGDWIGTFEGHSGAVWSAKLNKDASIAVTGSADSTAKLWNGVSGELLHTFDHKRVVRTVDFSPDGSRIVTGGYEMILRIFDATSPSSAPILVDHPGGARIKKVAWSHDGRLIYTGDEAGTVRMWDVASMRVVRQADVVRGSPEGIMDMEVSESAGPGGGSAGTLTVAGGSVVGLLSTADLAEKARHELPYPVEAASLHPNGRYFVAGGADVRVRIHDSSSGKEVHHARGHHGKVHAVRFAPNGETYSSGADDATIRLWKFDENDIQAAANRELQPSPTASSASGSMAGQGQGQGQGSQATPIPSAGYPSKPLMDGSGPGMGAPGGIAGASGAGPGPMPGPPPGYGYGPHPGMPGPGGPQPGGGPQGGYGGGYGPGPSYGGPQGQGGGIPPPYGYPGQQQGGQAPPPGGPQQYPGAYPGHPHGGHPGMGGYPQQGGYYPPPQQQGPGMGYGGQYGPPGGGYGGPGPAPGQQQGPLGPTGSGRMPGPAGPGGYGMPGQAGAGGHMGPQQGQQGQGPAPGGYGPGPGGYDHYGHPQSGY